jgi:dephospho-CoA kinase
LFASLGAHVLQSDAIGRELMEPGQAVYTAIADHFGGGVVQPDGRLDRVALAKIAFDDGRVEELNAIVHPAVIARQAELNEAIFQKDRGAIVIVESALIFETKYGETKYSETKYSEAKDAEAKDVEAKDAEAKDGEANYAGSQAIEGAHWRNRFDRIILVTAPEEVKIARFVARCAGGEAITAERRGKLEAEARSRLAQQIPDEQKSALSDYVLTNGGSLAELEWQVDQLWPILKAAAE